MTATRYVLGPGDAPDLAAMGGKAHALAKLGQSFPIPPWCVVTPAAFDGDGLRPEAVAELRTALAGLGPGAFAVRSSAVDEDQAQRSFAGQLKSFLQVAAAEVPQRILAVRDSGASETVRAYRQRQGLPGPAPVPAVLVQRMVQADCAGVAFSVDPLAETSEQVVVSAVRGLAERLVGGEVEGDTYRLLRDGTPRQATLVSDVPILDPTQQAEVAALALRAEAHFGGPQDIEWAYGEGQLFLLQSRPITTLETGEPTLWDNANIVESYSGVTLPLTFSFARYVYAWVYRAFVRLLGVSAAVIGGQARTFENMLGYVDGHVYYNLLNWYRVLAMLPGFAVNRAFMEQMMGVSAALPRELADRLAAEQQPPGGLGKVLDGLRLARSLVHLLGHALWLRHTIARFEQRLGHALAPPDPPLEQRDLMQLARYYRELEKALLNRWDAPLINDFLCMVAFGASQALLRRWLGKETGRSLHNDFMIGQGDIVSAEPARRIRAMAEMVRGNAELVAALCAGDRDAARSHPPLAEALAAYLEKFGDRCTQELKLESLTLADDPTPLLQAVGHAAEHAASARQRPASDPDAALSQALAGWRLAVSRRAVAWAKARVRDRENLRFQRTRLFGRVRRLFLAIGARLAQAGLLETARDVFCLEVQEVLGLVEGTATLIQPRELATLRRRQAERQAASPPPPNRFWTHGALCTARRREAEAGTPTATADSRQGLGCCRGVVRGRVRVVTDPRREALRAGEILVARHTDPGWIALFCSAAGIVVERGSLLSHSAIVAREMDIPAVVAVSGLLDWLATGDLVEIDGGRGSVTRLETADGR